MSAPSITPARICQSDVQLQPLSQLVNIEAIQTFKKLLKTSIGRQGQLKMIRNSAGGHITLTSSSTRLLQNISMSNNFLKFICSSAKSHLASYGDNGLTCAFLTSLIIDTSLGLSFSKTTVSKLNGYFGDIYLDYLASSAASCVLVLDFSDFSPLLTIVHNILSSKPGCALSQNQIQHLEILLLKSFLNSISDCSSETPSQVSQVTFATVEGISADESHLYDGLLIRCPEIMDKVNFSAFKSSDAFKVAVFSVSLAGDAAFSSKNLEVRNVDIWKVVLDHLRSLASRLIQNKVHIVACQKVIHPILRKQLEKENILVIERLGFDSTKYLTYISGATPITSLSNVCKMTYGYISAVEYVKLEKKQHFLLKNKSCPFQTLLLCSYNEESLNETKVVCEQALNSLYWLLKNPRVCYGGGCTETHVSSVLEKLVKTNIHVLAEEFDCNTSVVLAVLQNFISCLTEIAVTYHQDSGLNFATDAIHHHLWKCNEDNFPYSGDSCMCGSYRAEDFTSAQWSVLGSQVSVSLENKDSGTSCHRHVAHKPQLLDVLSARTNALRVAFETSSVLLSVNLCIVNSC